MDKGTIYCILGGSGTGKTTLANTLAQNHNATQIQTDTYRTKLQQDPNTGKMIQALLPDSAYIMFSQDELLAFHMKISSLTSEYLISIIDQLIDSDKPTVIEGDDITSKAVTSLKNNGYSVRAVCLSEPDKELVYQNIRKRDKSLMTKPTQVVSAQLQHAYRNGVRITQNAKQADIPIITSRPLDTLYKRTCDTFDIQSL